MQNKQRFSLSDNQCAKIMLALCSMLLATYYAPNYAGIIGAGLIYTSIVPEWKLTSFAMETPLG